MPAFTHDKWTAPSPCLLAVHVARGQLQHSRLRVVVPLVLATVGIVMHVVPLFSHRLHMFGQLAVAFPIIASGGSLICTGVRGHTALRMGLLLAASSQPLLF